MPERARGKPAGRARPRRETLGDRIARLRGRAGGRPAAPAQRAERVSRREQDARKQRLLRTGIAVAGAVVAVVLLVGALNEWVLKPRAVLAEVAGEPIQRSDYWTARAVDLVEQALLYEQFADLDPSGNYQAQADAALAQIPGIRGGTDTDPGTLERVIEDRLFVRGAEAMGLAVTEAEAEEWMLDRFAPEGASLRGAPPTPTLTPARVALQTATAVADALSLVPAVATPGVLPPPPALGSGDGGGVPAVVATPVAEATIDAVDARATAEAELADFEAFTLGEVGLTREDYLRFAAVPAVAREKVEDAIAADVGQSAPQVNAAHVLVATRDLAERLSAELAAGADFAAVARENSIDEGTAGNGGDLGWFVREEVVAPFAEAAFALEPGQTSEPFETEFGWHIVRVLESDPDRPLTDEQIERIRQVRTDEWLAAQRAEADVTTSLPPTPTPPPGEFAPPLDAPAPPPPTVPAPATPADAPTTAATPAG